ncbi:hypothetical protein QUA82_08025 [Microcoleus sp. F8-D3]
MKAALRLKLELGVRSQESGGRRKKSEGRSQNKCFYKYEMLPRPPNRAKLPECDRTNHFLRLSLISSVNHTRNNSNRTCSS